jgi:hypothetical protein
MNKSRKKHKNPTKENAVVTSRWTLISSYPALQFFRKLDPLIILVALLSLVIRILVPANVFTNTPHDDLLGVQLANNLLNGDWLGVWDNRTLVKPAGYSYFLVLCHFLPIEPQIILHMIYLCSAAYFVWIVKRIFPINSASIAFLRLSFTLMALNPMLISGDFSRIYRMSLNVVFAQFTILVVIHYWLLLTGDSTISSLRPKFLRNNERKTDVYFSILLGLLYAGLVLTRSEAIWILYPVLTSFFVFAIFGWLKYKGHKRRNHISRLILISTVATIGFAVPIEGIKQINSHYYGSTTLENYYSGQFARAFSLWTGVDGGKPNLTSVPINATQRAIVYQISPTAKSLEKSLETPPNTGWKIFNCQQSGVCDETGPWFPFELRDVATQVFGIDSEAKFQQVFRQIADDILEACNSKVIKCKRAGFSTGTLSLQEIPKRQMVNDLAIYFSSLSNLDQANEIVRRDGGSDPAQLKIWDSVVHINRLFMPDDKHLFLVLGDVVANLKVLYSKIYPVLIIIFAIAILLPRQNSNIASQVRLMLLFLFSTIALYGVGMAIFHSATNNSAGSSFYTQPAAPIFLTMLLLSLHLTIAEASKAISTELNIQNTSSS